METAIVSIICIALIVVGGMTMSQGFLSSADTARLAVEAISVRDGEIMRTELAIVGATGLSWANSLRVISENSGQTKLGSFSKWDVIVQYYDGGSTYHTEWLPYTDGALGNNEWRKTGIYVNGQPEVFEPAILNPGEEMVIDTKLSPLPQEGTGADVIIATPNGVRDSLSFSVGYPILTPHAETTIIAGARYYRLKEGTAADGTAVTMTTDSIDRRQTGRWLLHNESDDSRLAKHVYPLTGINDIPPSTWTVYYRGQATGWWRGDPSLSIDVIIRRSDGTIRETIATDVADAVITSFNTWVTISATYSFPGYTVVDDTDYLEIDYYGKSSGWGPWWWGSYIQLRVDDSGLAVADQTRVDT